VLARELTRLEHEHKHDIVHDVCQHLLVEIVSLPNALFLEELQKHLQTRFSDLHVFQPLVRSVRSGHQVGRVLQHQFVVHSVYHIFLLGWIFSGFLPLHLLNQIDYLPKVIVPYQLFLLVIFF